MDNVTERCGHCQEFRGTTLFMVYWRPVTWHINRLVQSIEKFPVNLTELWTRFTHFDMMLLDTWIKVRMYQKETT